MTASDASSRIDAERRGDVLAVRLANPRRANALTHDMLRALADLLAGPASAEARAVVLTGAGERHFSAGLDLAGVRPDGAVAHLRAGEGLLLAASTAIVGCRRPVVAVVNGAALGGGLELAMACDWRIAERGARMGMPAARIGVVYAPAGLRRAVELLGPARARRLFLTGRPVDAEEAFHMGLVDELVEPGEGWAAGERAGADIAACSPLAVEGTRAVIGALSAAAGADDADAMADRWRRRAFEGDDLRARLERFAGGGDAPRDVGG